MKVAAQLFFVVLVIAGTAFLFGKIPGTGDTTLLTAQIPKAKWALFYRYKVTDVEKVKWAGHTFERGILATNEYKTDGNKKIVFTDSGYRAPSYSLARSKLVDVNLNQKIKVRITGTFEGELLGPNKKCTSEGKCTISPRHFSEFAIYMTDESDNAQGMRNLGSKENARSGNIREKYRFTSLTVENTGDEIIVTDSSGLTLSYSTDFKYVTAHGKREEHRGASYGTLDPKQKWFLRINCHVNGEGYCNLDIKNIEVVR